MRHEPFAITPLEAGRAADPVARGAPSRLAAHDERQEVAERGEFARYDAQVLDLEADRSVERRKPALEVLPIGVGTAGFERRLRIEHHDVLRIERHEAIDVLVTDRLAEILDAPAKCCSDRGCSPAIRS